VTIPDHEEKVSLSESFTDAIKTTESPSAILAPFAGDIILIVGFILFADAAAWEWSSTPRGACLEQDDINTRKAPANPRNKQMGLVCLEFIKPPLLILNNGTE